MSLSTFNASAHQFEAAHQGALVVDLGPIITFHITGTDAVRYLHGRVTQDIKKLQPGQGTKALILTPQGKVQGQLVILRGTEAFTILGDPTLEISAAGTLAHDLLQFRVADDLQLEDRTGQVRLLRLIGPQADLLLSAHRIDPIPKEHLRHQKSFFPILETSFHLIRFQMGAIPAIDILLPSDPPSIISDLLAPLQNVMPKPVIGDVGTYHALRILAGIPKFRIDISEKSSGSDLPTEGLIAFDKGCYTGQEVIEMATARGRPQRKLVRIESPNESAPQDVIEVSSDQQNWTRCGEITSAAIFSDRPGGFALGFIKYDIDGSQHFRVNEVPVTLREVSERA